MLKITADEELRLAGGDVQWLILRVNRIPDFLHLGFQTRNRFANGREQAGTVNFRILEGTD